MNHYIGIDIGGTNTKIALVNQLGEYTSLSRVYYNATELSIKSFLAKLIDIVDKLTKLHKDSLAGIGISSPGLQMEKGNGTLFSTNLPFLNKFDMKKFWEERYMLPCVVSNDLVAHGLAESMFGSGKGIERFLSVSLGTGIGHAFFYRNKPQISINGISGDSARIIIDPNSDITDLSGISGSAEALCGVNAIELLGQEYFTGENKYSAQEIITKAREEKDSNAIKILSIVSHRLAVLLIDLSAIYYPEIITITGGQTEAGQFFIEECQKEFDRRAFRFFKESSNSLGNQQCIRIIKSKAGGLAGLIGSIVPFLN